MKNCLKCGRAMIRVGMYDPEGTTPLQRIVKIDGEPWVCAGCQRGSEPKEVTVIKQQL